MKNKIIKNSPIISEIVGYTKVSDYAMTSLAKWLRDTHNTQVYAYSHTISTINGIKRFKDYVVYINNIALNDARDEQFDTYEKALDYGLRTALIRILEQKNSV